MTLEAGCKTILVHRHLDDLNFAEGTFPTPYSLVKVKHTKLADGSIKSEISAPKEVKVVR